MNTFYEAILMELKNIEKSFSKDELAYLALTSKIELPIRDKLAFTLYKKFFSENIFVVREYSQKTDKRNLIDLAIIKDKKLDTVFEFKAGYTSDPYLNLKRYIKWINDDLKRSKAIFNSLKYFGEAYAVLFLTHVKSPVENNKTMIKYYQDINKIHKKHKEQDIISGIHNTLKPDGKIEGGTAFGYEVDIYYKIIREEISLL